MQFAYWAEAIIFVFSVDSEESFQEVQKAYSILNSLRNLADVPIILVGTQGIVLFSLSAKTLSVFSIDRT